MDDGTSFKRQRRDSYAETSSSGTRSQASGEQGSETQIGFGIEPERSHRNFGSESEGNMETNPRKYFKIFDDAARESSNSSRSEIDSILEGDGPSEFYNDLLQYFSKKNNIQRKIIHDIVDIRDDGNIDLMLKKCIGRARKCNIRRCIMSKHFIGPKKHIHLIHDCPWTNRECKCFYVPVRPRVNAIHPSDDWDPEDWAKLIKYLCQNGRRLSYCKSTWQDGKEWLERKGATCEEFYSGREYLPDECNSGNPKTRPLEIRSGQYFTCCPGERLSIPSNFNMEQDGGGIHNESRTPRNKKSRATAEDVETFVLKNITTPPENCTKTVAWKTNPKFKFVLPKDDCFKRGIHAFKNMILGATYQDLIKIYEEADTILFKAENIKQYEEMYHTPDASFEICKRLLQYQLQDIADQEHLEVEDVIAEFIEDLYYILEKKSPDRKKNTFEIIGPPQSWKSWFTKQIANFYISVGDIGSCTKGERFPFQDAVNSRVNIMNDKDVHPDALTQFLGILGGDEDKVAQKGVSGEEITRIPVIHTNNKELFYSSVNLEAAFRTRIIHYRFKCIDDEYFKCVGQKICNPLVWPKLINFAKEKGYIKDE